MIVCQRVFEHEEAAFAAQCNFGRTKSTNSHGSRQRYNMSAKIK